MSLTAAEEDGPVSLESVRKEIAIAATRLKLTAEEFALEGSSEQVLDEIAKHYEGVRRPHGQFQVKSYGFDSVSAQFIDGRGYERLPEIVPPNSGHVWFVAVDNALDSVAIYNGTIESIRRIIGESYGFEYYIVDPKFQWLVLENHHDVVVALGSLVVDRLNKLIARHADAVRNVHRSRSDPG
jgi:hypothetical protein